MNWLRQLRAFMSGTFWLPCPRCGEHFGGYEVRRTGVVTVQRDGRSYAVCRRCAPQVTAELMGELRGTEH